uniref:Uncharacterized protein n=1 Tax=Graphocephala atropunctata TaxID=36148 RepID=A0A1B6MUZ5_9HEMI
MCVTNNVARNESMDLKNKMSEFLENVTDQNGILVDVPNRYDLVNWSCVNKETRKTNRVLNELGSKYKNVTVVEASSAIRDMHTQQGMHFNSRGKRNSIPT